MLFRSVLKTKGIFFPPETFIFLSCTLQALRGQKCNCFTMPGRLNYFLCFLDFKGLGLECARCYCFVRMQRIGICSNAQSVKHFNTVRRLRCLYKILFSGLLSLAGLLRRVLILSLSLCDQRFLSDTEALGIGTSIHTTALCFQEELESSKPGSKHVT